MNNAAVTQPFWRAYQALLKDVVLPYQWDALHDKLPDAEKSYAVRNMRIAAGLEEGPFAGMVFQDSDLYKWIEAAAHTLRDKPDAALQAQVDQLIDTMEKAQRPDGYLNSFYIINGLDKRFTNLRECHELYCLGHMVEAAVAYYDATGKSRLLDIACRFVALVDTIFGTEPGQLPGYPGHQVLELALVKLYAVTKNERHLKLAQYFLDQRGREPNYFREEWEKLGRVGHWNRYDRADIDPRYNQAHLPVREQTEAVGHAVRAVYMYAGMAAVARETGDESLMAACRTLFRNIAEKQLYITGGIGQTRYGEAFTFDYDLPGDTVYAETCASIGLVFFARELLLFEHDARYADILETALYNTVIAGMARDGKHFFYVNPLETWPEANLKNPARHHVKPERQAWFGCSCCPPNVARLLASLGQYIYTARDNTLFVDLYIGSRIEAELSGGRLVLSQTTEYPWDGTVTLRVESDAEGTVALRLPGWCEGYAVTVNGADCAGTVKSGYLHITRAWKAGDTVSLTLPMRVKFMRAHEAVRAEAGRVAVTRGPLVYCLEQTDNGDNLSRLAVSPDVPPQYSFEPALLGGVGVIRCAGVRGADDDARLYHEYAPGRETPAELVFVPYFAWGNRGLGEMAVWVRYR